MVKKILLIILIIALVVFFGTWPLSIFGKVFEFIGRIFNWLASFLNFFGWNGLI